MITEHLTCVSVLVSFLQCSAQSEDVLDLFAECPKIFQHNQLASVKCVHHTERMAAKPGISCYAPSSDRVQFTNNSVFMGVENCIGFHLGVGECLNDSYYNKDASKYPKCICVRKSDLIITYLFSFFPSKIYDNGITIGCDYNCTEPPNRKLQLVKKGLAETCKNITVGCPEGRFGPDCHSSCGQCADGETCDHDTGFCPKAQCSGPDCGSICKEGYKAPSCYECEPGYLAPNCISDPSMKPAVSSDNTAEIVGGIIGGVAGVLLVSAVVIFLMRRRSSSNYQTETDSREDKSSPQQQVFETASQSDLTSQTESSDFSEGSSSDNTDALTSKTEQRDQ